MTGASRGGTGTSSGRADAAAAPRARARAAEWPFVLAIVALSLWVYRSALGAYFSPDDLIYLERVRGIVPEPPTLWRYLSGVAYFRVAHAVFGGQAFPYMLANWLLHGLAVASLYAWVRSLGGGVLAATLAGALFGTTRLFLTVVLQVVTVAEPLSLILALASLWMAGRGGWRWRLGAGAVFAAALLCKETVMLLPLLLLLPGIGQGSLRSRAVSYSILMVPSVLLMTYMSSPAVQAAIFVDDTYARAYGVNLFHSLMTFTDWATDLQTPVPDLYSILSTTAWRTALWILLAFTAVAAFGWRSTRLPAMGLAWWLLTLAPVLPLLKQRYLHYLYVPLAGLAIALGAGFEWLAVGSRAGLRAHAEPGGTRGGQAAAGRATARPGGGRLALGWGIAGALIIGHVALSGALIKQRATQRLPIADLPFDPFLRKAEMARRVIARVGEAIAGRRVSAVFVVPASGGSAFLARVLHSIMGEGRALRAVYPNLDSVAFVPRWTPAYRDFELFYGRVDGNVVDLGRGPEAHHRLAELMIADRCVEDARAELEAALAVWPDDPRLRSLQLDLRSGSFRAPVAPRR